MPKKRSPKRRPKAASRNYVVVTNRTYGAALRGVKIYWEGRRPKALKKDGRINLGKNILEIVKAKFPRFRWIITEDTDSITTERSIVRVRTSQRLLRKMGAEQIARNRDIKTSIIRRFFSIHFSDQFKEVTVPVYAPGTLAGILRSEIIPRLSNQDKEAMNAFLPDYVASEALATVNALKATAQIKSLKALAADLEREIGREHPESWWQEYIRSNIVLIQPGYIEAVGKLNTIVGGTKFPDFLLVTHDSYLDIMEIKRPNTPLLRPDAGRGNFYFETEISKAVIQTENYIAQVIENGLALSRHLRDTRGIDIRVVRPRGIVLAGDSRQLSTPKERDDFRLLSQGIKNVTVVTYDELLTRLQNYISVLEEFSKTLPARPRGASAKGSEAKTVK